MNGLLDYVDTTDDGKCIVKMDMHAMFVIKHALNLSGKRALVRARMSMSPEDMSTFVLQAEDCNRLVQDLDVVIEARRGI